MLLTTPGVDQLPAHIENKDRSVHNNGAKYLLITAFSNIDKSITNCRKYIVTFHEKIMPSHMMLCNTMKEKIQFIQIA